MSQIFRVIGKGNGHTGRAFLQNGEKLIWCSSEGDIRFMPVDMSLVKLIRAETEKKKEEEGR